MKYVKHVLFEIKASIDQIGGQYITYSSSLQIERITDSLRFHGRLRWRSTFSGRQCGRWFPPDAENPGNWIILVAINHEPSNSSFVPDSVHGGHVYLYLPSLESEASAALCCPRRRADLFLSIIHDAVARLSCKSMQGNGSCRVDSRGFVSTGDSQETFVVKWRKEEGSFSYGSMRIDWFVASWIID